MDFLISTAQAQAAGAAPGQPGMLSPLLLMVGFVIFFWFIVIRPQTKRAKEHRSMIDALKKGDEVVCAGGLMGQVEDITDHWVRIEIASGVSIRVQKHAVTAVLPKGTLKSE